MRPNQTLSTNRQDDLLMRLKNCVGEIQTKPKESSYSTKKYTSSRQIYKENIDKSFQSATKRNYSNLIEKDGNNKSQNQRQCSIRKLNLLQDQQNILLRTKRYLQGQQNINKSYWTDRKRSIPLNQSNDILNLKKNIFINQNQQQKLSLGQKNVISSTKKRIMQRASLIDQEMQKITPKKSFQTDRNDFNAQKSFLDILNDKKIEYGYQRKQILDEKKKSLRQSPIKNEYQDSKQRQSLRRKQFIDERQVEIKKIRQPLQKMNSQKYENYSKFSMETLVKQNDFRKAQKMQKLKKITQINEGINNRIRKLVDNFQNYLTHLEIS